MVVTRERINRLPERRIAVPIPEGMIDPEAVDNALNRYAESVRENRRRPKLDKHRRPWLLYEPLDSSL